jgi:hypothetical protein
MSIIFWNLALGVEAPGKILIGKRIWGLGRYLADNKELIMRESQADKL